MNSIYINYNNYFSIYYFPYYKSKFNITLNSDEYE